MIEPDRTGFARTVVHALHASSASVIEAEYAPNTDFDTHEHEESYLCLVVEGEYREWCSAPGARCIVANESTIYEAGSRHAVRTGDSPVRIVHVTDPTRRDWRARGPIARGALWQIAASLDRERALGGARSIVSDDAALMHVEALVVELCCPLGDARSASRGIPPRRGAPDWLDRVRDRLRSAYRDPVSLTELAREVDRHPAHLARAFRSRWAMTPGEYLRRIRVASAIDRLLESEEPASRVALETGFADQSHMGRWMRRYAGVTPGSLRGRH